MFKIFYKSIVVLTVLLLVCGVYGCVESESKYVTDVKQLYYPERDNRSLEQIYDTILIDPQWEVRMVGVDNKTPLVTITGKLTHEAYPLFVRGVIKAITQPYMEQIAQGDYGALYTMAHVLNNKVLDVYGSVAAQKKSLSDFIKIFKLKSQTAESVQLIHTIYQPLKKSHMRIRYYYAYAPNEETGVNWYLARVATVSGDGEVMYEFTHECDYDLSCLMIAGFPKADKILRKGPGDMDKMIRRGFRRAGDKFPYTKTYTSSEWIDKWSDM